MHRTSRSRFGSNRHTLPLLLMIAVAGVGAIDAAIGKAWDLLVVLVLVVVLGVVGLGRMGIRRQSIGVRRDLLLWMRVRAAQSGEACRSTEGCV